MKTLATCLMTASLCLALMHAHADTVSGPAPVNKLPVAPAPPACICTPTSGGNFIIANCQCGNTQCVAAIGGSGAGATSIACVR